MKKFRVKVILKRKYKKNCVYFLFLFIKFRILDTSSYFNKKLTKRKILGLVIASQNGMLAIPHGFFKF